jgi:hypothetical protein
MPEPTTSKTVDRFTVYDGLTGRFMFETFDFAEAQGGAQRCNGRITRTTYSRVETRPVPRTS